MKRGGYLKRTGELKRTGGLKRKPMKHHKPKRRMTGDGWHLDKLGRWRSPLWLQWIREQKPAGRTNGTNGVHIVAAHFRYPGCGAGTKPDDCLAYPLDDETHKGFHNHGQPAFDVQWAWVWRLWQAAAACGLLVIQGDPAWPIREDTVAEDQSELAAVLSWWRHGFEDGALSLGKWRG